MGAFSLSGSKVRRHIPGLGGNGYDMGFILPQADKRVHHQPESRTVSRSRRRGKEWEQDDGRHQRVVVQRLMGLGHLGSKEYQVQFRDWSKRVHDFDFY